MDEPYAKLRKSIMERRDLLPASKLVLACIEDRIGQNGKAWPSCGRICSDTGLSDRTARRVLIELVEKGLLQVKKKVGRSSVYQTYSSLFKDAPEEPEPRSICQDTPVNLTGHPGQSDLGPSSIRDSCKDGKHCNHNGLRQKNSVKLVGRDCNTNVSHQVLKGSSPSFPPHTPPYYPHLPKRALGVRKDMDKQKKLSEKNGLDTNSPSSEDRTNELFPGAFTKPGPPDITNRAKRITKKQIEGIYQAYPKHIGKRAALKAIKTALDRIGKRKPPPDDPVAWLLERVQVFAASPKGSDGKFTPYPATWFNQDRFDDDPKEWLASKAKPARQTPKILDWARKAQQKES